MRFREFLQEEAMQAYVCVQSGHGIQIDGETRWFEIGDVVYARKRGNFYDVLIGDKIKSWWHKFFEEIFFRGTLEEYQRKFLDDLREEEMSALDFVKMYAKNISKHIPLDIKEVPVHFKETAYSKKKQCYNNSIQYLIIENDKAKYVLGFVMVHGVPIEHAWIKEDDKYFDVTIQNTGPYFSLIELDYSQVMKFFRKNHFGPDLLDVIRSGIAKS